MAFDPFRRITLVCLVGFLCCANGLVYETEDAIIVEGKY